MYGHTCWRLVQVYCTWCLVVGLDWIRKCIIFRILVRRNELGRCAPFPLLSKDFNKSKACKCPRIFRWPNYSEWDRDNYWVRLRIDTWIPNKLKARNPPLDRFRRLVSRTACARILRLYMTKTESVATVIGRLYCSNHSRWATVESFTIIFRVGIQLLRGTIVNRTKSC